MDTTNEELRRVLTDIRRLLLERDAKKKEMDAIDHAIALAVGLGEDRPKKRRLSVSEFRTLCGMSYDISKKKQHAVGSGVVRGRKEEKSGLQG